MCHAEHGRNVHFFDTNSSLVFGGLTLLEEKAIISHVVESFKMRWTDWLRMFRMSRYIWTKVSDLGLYVWHNVGTTTIDHSTV